ncbi:hypothetical protein GOQ29_06815 [Clostridium sp. D2Q-14]|uniref:hypothetical protein n=1 Tax=Anaeromonas gelatinilytica TaxID=2683194 RepID=UPI00193C673C|nr:hypothetical protein [Anaeromonas gelatinilytica]MBS4535328.1 hypothetical protein [Anaeromonas gelatinilytica]
MENTENLLKQILNSQNDIKQDINNMNQDITDIKQDINNIKQDVTDMKSKLNSVVDQTANLTEFKTHTNQSFSDIKDTLKFIIHKEVENEQEIFKLKQVNNKK